MVAPHSVEHFGHVFREFFGILHSASVADVLRTLKSVGVVVAPGRVAAAAAIAAWQRRETHSTGWVVATAEFSAAHSCDYLFREPARAGATGPETDGGRDLVPSGGLSEGPPAG